MSNSLDLASSAARFGKQRTNSTSRISRKKRISKEGSIRKKAIKHLAMTTSEAEIYT
jgi:hypothetical protein